uniref:Ras association domain family member 3 n=1 Tax=Astyanax mexicanus TaxID=7994 RepID=A0A8B9KPB6_ASTMX
MTWTSTMSSGYSSLEEDSEEYFFTARTSFFKKPAGKLTEKKDVEKERELRTHLSYEEIRQKVELYNSASRDHLKMTLNADGLYTGFIKVQLELRRPITVTGGGGGGQEAFYLPRGCVNTLHISSSNTVRQVIEALLRKFTVADNPAKFALYKRSRREDHGEWNCFFDTVAHHDNFYSYILVYRQRVWIGFTAPYNLTGKIYV